MKFINIGYGNLLAIHRIVSIVPPDPAPIKRLVGDAKADGRVIDSSSGKATKSVIITDSEHIILSALSPEVILERIAEETAKDDAVQDSGGEDQ